MLFAPIIKLDLERREVTGLIAEERTDKAGEKFDYAASKPHFQSWSAGIKKGSGGKSLGNVRRMHQPHVAGVVKELGFLDSSKTIPVRARVLDNDDWAKCLEGGYTGFSIGGKYAKKWPDPDEPGVTRYEAVPSEISLVDNPCMYGATFQVVKGDGIAETRPFGGELGLALAKVVRREGDKWVVYSEDQQKKLGEHGSAREAYAQLAAVEHSKERAGKGAGADDMEKVKRTDEVSAADKARAAREYGDVEYADPENKRYPVDTAAHVRAAWSYINMPKNAAKYADRGTAVKRRIVAAWKKQIDAAGPPGAEKVAKGYFEVGRLADICGQLEELLDRLAVEQLQEGDDSAAVTALEAAARGLGDALVALTREENEEFATDDDAAGPGGGLMAMAAGADNLAKVGARNAAADLKRINAIHSMSVELGAACGPSMSKREETMTEQELEKAVLGAVAKNNDALAKSVTDLVTKVAGETVEKAIGSLNERLEKSAAESKDLLTKATAETKAALEKVAADAKGELEKVATEVKARHETVEKALGDLTGRLEKVEQTPLLPKGAKIALGKGADVAGKDAPEFDMEKATPQQMIKHLHSQGGKLYQPGISA